MNLPSNVNFDKKISNKILNLMRNFQIMIVEFVKSIYGIAL